MLPIPSTEPELHQVAVICPGAFSVMVLDTVEGLAFPSVSVSPSLRKTAQLVTALREEYGISVIVLDFLTTMRGALAVAEWLDPDEPTPLRKADLRKLPASIVDAETRKKVGRLFYGEAMSHSPFSRLAWWVDALDWVEQTTRKHVVGPAAIRQINMEGFFTLVQFPLSDGDAVWLKATGAPNEHERAVTKVLASLSPLPGDPSGYVPSVLAERPNWNAWLMCGAAKPFPEPPTTFSETLALLKTAVQSLAHLQIAALEALPSLDAAGAFDQSWNALRAAGPEVFAFIREAMPLQTSIKAPILPPQRITELYDVFCEACDTVEGLRVPASVLHGELTVGNLVMGEQCQFIDWAETYVGCPIVSLEHLLLLNRLSDDRERASLNDRLRRQYMEAWERHGACDKDRMERAFGFAPFLAAYSALYGRGYWIDASQDELLGMQAYARTLARHMDRAALEMQEARSL